MTTVPAGQAVRRHLIIGWVYIGVFMLLGLTLEALHGFKVSWYLSVTNETRRFLWTLAHAHGVLLGVVNLAFAFTLAIVGEFAGATRASWLLLAGSVLLPAGFLLGGTVVYGGDPGVFIALAPIGGVLLAMAALAFAAGLWRHLQR